MGNDIKTIKESVQLELLNTTFDLSQEYAEILIDQLLDNDAFKEIPIVKTVVGLTKGVIAIHELVFARKLAVFFRQFHKGLASASDSQTMIKYLESDLKKRDRIIEQIIIMNERYIETKKSIVHANLLLAHLKLKLSFEELNDLIICLDILHPKSIDTLDDLSRYRFVFAHGMSGPWVEPLRAVGLAMQYGTLQVTELGRKLYYYGVLGDFDAQIPPFVLKPILRR